MIKTRIDPSDCKKCISARPFFGNAFAQVTAINLIGNVVSRRAMHANPLCEEPRDQAKRG
ncbi:hypothetical protein HB770_19910 [Rhizobium leguminosarum bv. viciae]|uniref:Uncharacterized protein n=1 Tax=Rhizobium leguminosarum bv. viciae TaxID=387 RepID=A0A7G6RKU8_RHILV|nr:hypothetical protein HB770_19910 [Rhizobium leguminosarum bv. viciae]